MTPRYSWQIGFAWIAVCLVGCSDAAQVSGFETGANVQLIVPREIGELLDGIGYEFVCDRDGPSESQVEGSLEPPNANPGSEEIEQLSWTASVELPPGECVLRTTTPIENGCNSCWVSEPVTIEPGTVTDLRMVLLCTLSFCAPSGKAELTISVADDPGVPELNDQLAYTLACDGAETGFDESIVLNGKLKATESSHPPRWDFVFKDLPAGPCNVKFVASDIFGDARCEATRDFDIHVNATTTLNVDLHCGG